MAVFKCKMCGGDLNITEGITVAECEYCGTKQTVPSADNEKKLTLFSRANRLRFACEFDKATGIYESIVAEFPEEAEAYWGLVLCKYGIEYVDDPATAKKIPTCHRSSFDPVLDDSNFELVMEYADSVARGIYREEAKQIEELRKGIIEVSSKEEPYDIFICYKETAENGDRTIDSVIAQDVYTELVSKGYRVFFSRITLEDKLGQEYEPYIFAALNSAKIMLAFGTHYDYYNAVWVKNEWSRFLQLISRGEKKTLIPCYKDIDAYDMPKEFAKLQAQDMGKVGAIQDLLRGIEKILPRGNASVPQGNSSVSTQGVLLSAEILDEAIRKVLIQLENKKWKAVKDMCDKLTDADPECAMAYVCQLARMRRVTKLEDLGKCANVLSNSDYYTKALKYADDELKAKLENWCRQSEETSRLAEERCAPAAERAKKLEGIIAGGKNHTVAIFPDGTVKATGSNEFGQCDVELWRDIVYVCCGSDYTIGVRSDGTAIACGNNDKGQCEVAGWTDIVQVDAYNHTVGVKRDGTVVACGDTENGKCNINGWTDIVKVQCGYRHTVGIKKDGTLVAVGGNATGQCNIENWENIVNFSASNGQTVGFKKYGTVVKCGDTENQRLDTRTWNDIVAVSCGTHHTVGLHSDGTVIACGDDGGGRTSATKNWSNIIAFGKSYWTTIGIRADGTVTACGDNDYDRISISDWKLFENINTLEAERDEVREKKKLNPELRKKLRDKAERIFSGCPYAILDENGTPAFLEQNCKDISSITEWKNIARISVDSSVAVGIKQNGTVISTGTNWAGMCNTDYWMNIVDISAEGGCYTVGLRSDGTVVACGDNQFGQCNVDKWTDVVAIKCVNNHTFGIRSDGTVLACGKNEYKVLNVQHFRDVVSICGSIAATYALKNNGTVDACGTGYFENVKNWKNIVQLSCSNSRVIALREDGKVEYSTNDIGVYGLDWKDIVAVAAISEHAFGLKNDGSVICSSNSVKTSHLMDIVAIGSSQYTFFALSDNGTIHTFCRSWESHEIFDDVEKLLEDRYVYLPTDPYEIQQIVDSMNALNYNRMAAGVCRHCGGSFEGILTKKCTVCGEKKDY